MSNKIKYLLINLLLLAGVYCSWGCSRCADCCKKCCEKKDLYFKIKGEAINNNDLGCFGKSWFEVYNNINNNNAILLYKLTEQKNKQEKEAGTLVYSKESEKLEYKNGDDLPDDLKDSNDRWAIFKVTTLNKVNNQEQKGNSHIFYCSDVSSLSGHGLFEEIDC
ncbi:MAG: hypothetical protein II393_03110 [Cytophagales bacterium]|nr:hypothetical protein [Cytophagales bacterium]